MNRRRDRRLLGIVLTLSAVFAGGVTIATLGPTHPPELVTGSTAKVDARSDPDGHARSAREAEVRRRFDAAVVMLHARQYEPAAAALHRVLELAPQMPEAHVNMGYAMLGLKKPAVARDFFEGATALKPDQANAYYGLALAWDAAGDRAMATGAMRSYLHLARQEDPQHLSRARAALWEWDSERAAQR